MDALAQLQAMAQTGATAVNNPSNSRLGLGAPTEEEFTGGGLGNVFNQPYNPQAGTFGPEAPSSYVPGASAGGIGAAPTGGGIPGTEGRMGAPDMSSRMNAGMGGPTPDVMMRNGVAMGAGTMLADGGAIGCPPGLRR